MKQFLIEILKENLKPENLRKMDNDIGPIMVRIEKKTRQETLFDILKNKPTAMVLRLYSYLVILFDCCIILLFFYIELLKSAFELIKPPPLKDLTGEIAIIVGSGRGVGRDLALQLAALNVKVICVDINSVENRSLIAKIRQNGGTAFAYECDITNHDEVILTVNAIDRDVGTATMLFHCCGIPSTRSLVEEYPPPIQSTLNISVISHFWLLEAILPKMRNINHGHIVFLVSVAGLSGMKHQIPLAVSQFAVQGLFESILDELRIEKLEYDIHTTLVHIYPFIIGEFVQNDIRLRIPSAFGTIRSEEAALQIIEGVRRNKIEISIPKYLLIVTKIIHLLPRRATMLLRELFDTGVDL